MDETEKFYNPELPEDVNPDLSDSSEVFSKSKKRKGGKLKVRYDGLADTYILQANGYEYVFHKGKTHKVHEDDLEEVLKHHNNDSIIFEQQEEV